MFSKFLWNVILDWTKGALWFYLGLVLYPIVDHLHAPTYWASITWTLLYTMAVTCRKLVSISKTDRNEKLKGGSNNQSSSRNDGIIYFRPMPRRYMLLDNIQLYDDFAGFLLKLGYQFFGIFRVLHRIGNNAFFVLLLLTSNSMASAMNVRERITSLSHRHSFHKHDDLDLRNTVIRQPSSCGSTRHLCCMTNTNFRIALANA